MDRRDFVRALVATGALGALGWTAPTRAAGGAAAVAIVAQRGVPQAGELADAIARTLGGAGIATAALAPAARWEFGDVAALLDRRPGSWLIGVTQDAPAEICQAVAATRGSACVLHAHHRIGRDVVRHGCTSPTLDAALVWSEPRADCGAAIGRLYAEALGAAPAPAVGVARRAAPVLAAASLASFLIRI